MKGVLSASAYLHLLRNYLQSSDEQYLHQVTLFGRECVKAQMAPEDVAELHTQAMLILAGEMSVSQQQLISVAGECLTEVMMSYSLAFREQLSRKQMDHQLRLFSQVVENTQDGIIITDLKGEIIQVNPAFTVVTGYAKEEIIGKNPRVLQSGRQGSLFYRQMWETLKAEGHWQGKIWNRRKSGESYPELLSITTVLGVDDLPAYYVGIFSDISEQVSLEQQLQQAQKMESIGTLVGGIAHDFNNMLAGISGNLFLLRKMAGEEERINRKLTDIEMLSKRAADMIQQLMAFSRKGVVQMQSMNLAVFVEQAVNLVRVGVPENINFSLAIEASDLVIDGDATQLQQVLMNLLNNARDAVMDVVRPEISMQVRRFEPDSRFLENHAGVARQSYALVTIADNGTGIAEDQLNQIFDPFYTTKEIGKGTGLGLSMVYGMMQSHSGIIEVDSKPGEGTSVKLYFPLRENQKVIESLSAFSTDFESAESVTILLADDEDELRRTVAEVLESFGYNVMQARDGLEAIDLFSEHHPRIDLLVLDVVMPHYGGPALAKMLHQISPRVPVLFATGYDRSHVLGYSDSTRRDHVLTKPFDFNEMQRVIRSLVQ